jgi:NAD(P)-dependent dehydrogenase (short-subunit alcohol dehydrogenase family)
VRTVLVTGASTGIGEACVLRLAAAGWRVFASVRREPDAERLRERGAGRVTPLRFDLTDEAALRGECARVVAECGAAGLQGVVNNAGIAVAGPLEFLPVAELRRQLEVNVVAQVAVAQALLPALRPARGRIVLIGSIAGRSAMPFMAPYAASKHALEAIADAWRLELAPWGMKVVLVEPGVIATPIWETSLRAADGLLGQLSPATEEYYGAVLQKMRARIARGMKGLPADAVARVVERALTVPRPRARYLIGRDAKLRAWLKRLPTPLQDRIMLEGLKRL